MKMKIFGGKTGALIDSYFEQKETKLKYQIEVLKKQGKSLDVVLENLGTSFNISLIHFDYDNPLIEDTRFETTEIRNNISVNVRKFKYQLPFDFDKDLLYYKPDKFYEKEVELVVINKHGRNFLVGHFYSQIGNELNFKHEKSICFGDLYNNYNQINQ